eukprot:TRINITY_DN196_c0_g1_i1.p1 TRINITY_DN196_c0_g1~~TRINITY_DN196_c0_g1_i1.p1  ORF type:complete len:266 (-),score=69.71 TRINITY_DN196_c0_g1_i1:117-812(-)
MKFIASLLLLTLIVVAVVADTCPSGTCPSTETCCDLGGGQYGCCPYPNADCCSDHLHCCPGGYTCDLSKGQCVQAVTNIRLPLGPVMSVDPTQTTCADGSSCPASETCCKLSSGSYGCCPYTDAACCSDGVHCCPGGYTCDVSKGECVKSNMNVRIPLAGIAVGSAKVEILAEANCADGSTCPAQSTCCELSSGGYGCCPFPSATCCGDHQHCCPQGQECDLEHSACKNKK